MNGNPDPFLSGFISALFIFTWIVLGIVGFFGFYLGEDVAFKRKWFRPFAILVGVLFIVFGSALTVLHSRNLSDRLTLFGVVPLVAIIVYWNIKITKFCDCGAMLYNRNWFSPMRFCSKCGASLTPKPKSHDDFLE